MGTHLLCTQEFGVRFSTGPPFSVVGAEVALLGRPASKIHEYPNAAHRRLRSLITPSLAWVQFPPTLIYFAWAAQTGRRGGL